MQVQRPIASNHQSWSYDRLREHNGGSTQVYMDKFGKPRLAGAASACRNAATPGNVPISLLIAAPDSLPNRPIMANGHTTKTHRHDLNNRRTHDIRVDKPRSVWPRPTIQQQAREICFNYLQGRCYWGAKCYRIHAKGYDDTPSTTSEAATTSESSSRETLSASTSSLKSTEESPQTVHEMDSTLHVVSMVDKLFSHENPNIIAVKTPKRRKRHGRHPAQRSGSGVPQEQTHSPKEVDTCTISSFSIFELPDEGKPSCVVNLPRRDRTTEGTLGNRQSIEQWDPGTPNTTPRFPPGLTRNATRHTCSHQKLPPASTAPKERIFDRQSHFEQKLKPVSSNPYRQIKNTPTTITVNILAYSKIKLGSGFEVLEVTTGFESRWIFIGGLPSSVTTDDILGVLRPFGQVTVVKFTEQDAQLLRTVKAHFTNHSEAVQAVTSLNGAQLFRHRVDARLAVGDATNLTGSLRDTSVLVEWEIPGKVAYAGFDTLEDANAAIEAARVQDRSLRGNIYSDLPAVGAVNVKFRRIPPDAGEEYVRSFCKPDSVMLERPNYVSLQGAINGIRNMLDELGQNTFEMVPPPYQDGMIHAWAKFTSPQLAKTAAEYLHGRKPYFVGRGYLWAYHMKTVGYKVASHVFHLVQADVNALRDSCMRRFGEGTFIGVYPKSEPVRIMLHGEKLKNLGTLKAEFEEILRGETLKQDGKPAWDPFFYLLAGREYLDELENDNRPVSIRPDVNRRTIVLFGPSNLRSNVRATLLQKIAQLKRQRVRSIVVPRHAVKTFMDAHLNALQHKYGPENINFNLTCQRLTIRGDDNVFYAVQGVIQSLPKVPTHRPREESECPVCFNDATSPIRLECGHIWCKACLAAYIVAAIDNKVFPLTCLGTEANCYALIPISIARQILPASDFHAVAQASFFAHVHARPKVFYYCPTPDCRQIYRAALEGTILQCPECLIRICPNCHVESHEGVDCEKPVGSAEQQFQEWTRTHDVKNCPGCKVPIERAEGCNHMTCTRCQTHSCWVCLATFPRGEGIYSHMRRKHGGIGL